MPESVIDAIDGLRQRFKKHQGTLSIKELEKEVDVNRMTLGSFVTGSYCSMDTLRKIEEWCQKQEAKEQVRATV